MLRNVAGFAIAGAVCLALAVVAEATGEVTASPVVTWSPDDPMDGGNDRGNHSKQVRIVRRGDWVHGLLIAPKQISPTYSWQGRTFTVDDYMKAYNVSGVLVLRDGEVILERYAQSRQPTDRWVSQSVAKSVTSLLYGAAICL